MADRRVFSLCGLRLRSVVELHLPEVSDDEWDVDVDWGADIHDSGDLAQGELIAEFELPDEGWWYRATATDSGYRLRFRGYGDFLLSHDLTELVVRPDPSGQVALLPILLAGTVGAFLLTLRGATVLHASAVSVGGKALAFIGQSGRGKSTLAALMCTSGANLVSDDVLRVDPGPPVACVGGATELRLRAAASALADVPGALSRQTIDERVALRFQELAPEALALGAIVVPWPSRTTEEVELTLLSPSTALCAFLAFPRVHGWCRADVLQRDFDVLSQVANNVPVYSATIPWGPPFPSHVAPTLAGLVGGRPPSSQCSEPTTARK
jgi:hypothetical protein